MRILHVIPQFPYFGGRTIVGGHATCLLTLALAQHEAGEEVSILSYTEGCDGRLDFEGPAVYSLFPHAKTRTVAYGLRFRQAAASWLRTRREQFDVVHFHSGYADYFLVSDRLKSVGRLPVAHTLYCPIPLRGGRWRLPGVHALIRRWANRLDWRGGISQNVTASMRAFGIRSVECIRPALDTERFSPGDDGAAVRRELGIAADAPVVLFVGNAKPQKNMLGALRAVGRVRPRFPGVKLIVTTELKHTSSEADLARLSAEISRLGLESTIIQQGIVGDMPALMRACDVLVAPFLDSFGPSDYFMAVLEAMACGKPVVVADVGGMREVVREGAGRLVDPRDDEAIASGLAAYLGDEALRARDGANARTQIEQRFQSHLVVAAYQDVYRRITS
jgi:glycosyltransferase involved in cell wall biosynthesis